MTIIAFMCGWILGLLGVIAYLWYDDRHGEWKNKRRPL